MRIVLVEHKKTFYPVYRVYHSTKHVYHRVYHSTKHDKMQYFSRRNSVTKLDVWLHYCPARVFLFYKCSFVISILTYSSTRIPMIILQLLQL